MKNLMNNDGSNRAWEVKLENGEIFVSKRSDYEFSEQELEDIADQILEIIDETKKNPNEILDDVTKELKNG